MSLVNTLTHHCTSEAVAEDGVPIAYEDLRCGEFLPLAGKNHVTTFLDVDTVAPAVDAFLDRVGAQNTGQGG